VWASEIKAQVPKVQSPTFEDEKSLKEMTNEV